LIRPSWVRSAGRRGAGRPFREARSGGAPGTRDTPGVGGNDGCEARALGIAATEAGYRTYFTTASDLVAAIPRAKLTASDGAAYDAEEATGQARQLLDAVDRLEQDLAEASRKIQAAIADTERDLAEAKALPQAERAGTSAGARRRERGRGRERLSLGEWRLSSPVD
jgi:hypothetical protein